MAITAVDQADGLRRLLGGSTLQICSVTSATAGVGKTVSVINLAVALARTGREVLVIDECPGHGNVIGTLGIRTRYELLDVINGERTLSEVLVRGPEGVSVLPAARGTRCLAALDLEGRERLIQCFAGLKRPLDVVLVDAGAGGSRKLPASIAAQEVLLVLSGTPASITGNYALIKKMKTQYAKRHFRILINKAHSEEEARGVFLNMARVAQRYLAVSLDYVDFIPRDGYLARAAMLCAAVVEVFPDAPSASRFRKIAHEVMRWRHREESQGNIQTFMQRWIRSSHLAAVHI